MVQYDIKTNGNLVNGCKCRKETFCKVFYEMGILASIEFTPKMIDLSTINEQYYVDTHLSVMKCLKDAITVREEEVIKTIEMTFPKFFISKNKRFGAKKGEKFENSDFMKIAFWEKCYAYYIKKADGDEQEQKYEWKGMEKSRFIKEFGSQKAVQNFYRCDDWFAKTKDISTFLSTKEKVKQWVLVGSKKDTVKHPNCWDVKYMESLQDVNTVISYQKHLKKLGYVPKRTPTRTVYIKQKQTI